MSEVDETVKKLEKIHQVASELTKKWFPDTEKYKNQRRIAVLSLMKMLVELTSNEKV